MKGKKEIKIKVSIPMGLKTAVKDPRHHKTCPGLTFSSQPITLKTHGSYTALDQSKLTTLYDPSPSKQPQSQVSSHSYFDTATKHNEKNLLKLLFDRLRLFNRSLLYKSNYLTQLLSS